MITRADTRCFVLGGVFFTRQYTVSEFSTHFVVERIGADCDAAAVELESVGRTDTLLVVEEQTIVSLICSCLENMRKTHLQDLVSSLLIQCENGPVGISHKHKGRFEVQVEAGLEASRHEEYVGEDSTWEGIAVEVHNLRIVENDLRERIANCNPVVGILSDIDLSHGGRELPVPIVGKGRDGTEEIEGESGRWIKEGVILLKIGDHSFL